MPRHHLGDGPFSPPVRWVSRNTKLKRAPPGRSSSSNSNYPSFYDDSDEFCQMIRTLQRTRSIDEEQRDDLKHAAQSVRRPVQRNYSNNSSGSPISRTKSSDSDSLSTGHRPMVQVTPELFVPLRGREETWGAYVSGQVLQMDCPACQIFMYCINKATLVLCPNCRIISPTSTLKRRQASLGLGLSDQAVLEEMECRK
jgi:hypothetical protein